MSETENNYVGDRNCPWARQKASMSPTEKLSTPRINEIVRMFDIRISYLGNYFSAGSNFDLYAHPIIIYRISIFEILLWEIIFGGVRISNYSCAKELFRGFEFRIISACHIFSQVSEFRIIFRWNYDRTFSLFQEIGLPSL